MATAKRPANRGMVSMDPERQREQAAQEGQEAAQEPPPPLDHDPHGHAARLIALGDRGPSPTMPRPTIPSALTWDESQALDALDEAAMARNKHGVAAVVTLRMPVASAHKAELLEWLDAMEAWAA